MSYRILLRTVAMLSVFLFVFAIPALAQAPKKGGVFRVGILGEPPALDPHWTTAAITGDLANHIFEGLYALDENYRPIPMLADGMPTISSDGLSYMFKLRQGIKFHNGKEMTSEDVVASLKRWSQQSIQGKSLSASVEDIRAVEKYTVEMKLKQKSPLVMISLAAATNFGAIYPKEIAEKFAPQVKATDYVGTGPFRLAEWKPDQYIRMVRFDDYKSLSGGPRGYGGGKTAYVDEIRWIPVPDVTTRVAQIETGELDAVDDLNIDAYERLKQNPNVRPLQVKPYNSLMAIFNKKEGLAANQKLRQACQAAIDIEPIMKNVAGGRPEFYRMESSLTVPEVAEWHVKIPDLPWNERNKEKAKRLLREAGYKGEPFRFLATQEYKWMYDFALITKQQLEDVGMNIDLQVVDWATLVKRRNNPKEYEAFTTGAGLGVMFDPAQYSILTCSWPGWTCDEEILRIQAELARETDSKKRYALWEQQHRVVYQYVPILRYGDLFGLRAIRSTVKGYNQKMERMRFTDVWLDR
jgi:peptide/nickel transport system substrate-binding protein